MFKQWVLIIMLWMDWTTHLFHVFNWCMNLGLASVLLSRKTIKYLFWPSSCSPKRWGNSCTRFFFFFLQRANTGSQFKWANLSEHLLLRTLQKVHVKLFIFYKPCVLYQFILIQFNVLWMNVTSKFGSCHEHELNFNKAVIGNMFLVSLDRKSTCSYIFFHLTNSRVSITGVLGQ